MARPIPPVPPVIRALFAGLRRHAYPSPFAILPRCVKMFSIAWHLASNSLGVIPRNIVNTINEFGNQWTRRRKLYFSLNQI